MVLNVNYKSTNKLTTYLNVCSCFSLRTVRTLVGLPSPDGPEGRLSLILLCDPDSLPESANEKNNNVRKCDMYNCCTFRIISL